MGYNRLHRTLIALHSLASWRWWQVASVLTALAALLTLWAAPAIGDLDWGFAVSVGFLLFVTLDAVLLLALPWLRLSFGPVQPALLSLAVVRWLVCLVAVSMSIWFGPVWVLSALAAIQLLITLLVVYGCFLEPFCLTVTHLEVTSPKLAGLERPLRLLHLSDLHMERPTPRDRKVLALAEELSPDLIVLTGDYLNLSYTDDECAVGHANAWLSHLQAPLGVFAVLGTPEVDVRHRVAELFDGTGVHLMSNEVMLLSAGEATLALLGVRCDRNPDTDREGLEEVLAHVPLGAFSILLYHIPDLMPEATARGVDLYLTGHTHGGQWRLPFYGAVITSSVYGKRYEMGHTIEGDTQLYVSRGLGMEGLAAPRARLLCRPEIVLVTLGVPGATRQAENGEGI